MNPDRSIVFYHAPHTRSDGVRMLLEELAVPYAMQVLNVKKGEQRMPAYLAINPMGKVPAITHGDALITEQGAVYQYLADLFPEVELAPQMGDPLRGPYLRWLYFYGSCFEPAVVDRSMKREPASPSTSPYGNFDTMLKTIDDQLATGPWLLGERFSAADVLWGSALGWTTGFKLVPASPSMQAYIDRFNARPAIARARAADAELAASQG